MAAADWALSRSIKAWAAVSEISRKTTLEPWRKKAVTRLSPMPSAPPEMRTVRRLRLGYVAKSFDMAAIADLSGGKDEAIAVIYNPSTILRLEVIEIPERTPPLRKLGTLCFMSLYLLETKHTDSGGIAYYNDCAAAVSGR